MKMGELKILEDGERVGNELPEGKVIVTPKETVRELEAETVEVDQVSREGEPYKRILVYVTIPLVGDDGTEYIERVRIGKLVGKDNLLKLSEAGKVFYDMEKGKRYELFIEEKETKIEGRPVIYKEYKLIGEVQ